MATRKHNNNRIQLLTRHPALKKKVWKETAFNARMSYNSKLGKSNFRKRKHTLLTVVVYRFQPTVFLNVLAMNAEHPGYEDKLNPRPE